MANSITFGYSSTKGCWVSEEIKKASMAYIQVERKEPGFLRVYTFAPGQSPVLAHVAQQANTAFCVGVLNEEVCLVMESESEVTRASACGGTTGVSLAALAGDGNASHFEMYEYKLGDAAYYTGTDESSIFEPSILLFTSEEFSKFNGVSANNTLVGVDELISAGMLVRIEGDIATMFEEHGIDVSGYAYAFGVFACIYGEVKGMLLYDGNEYPIEYVMKGSGTSTASTQQAAVGLQSANPLQQLSARLAARKEVKA